MRAYFTACLVCRSGRSCTRARRKLLDNPYSTSAPCGIGAFYRLFDLVSVSGTALLSCTLDVMSCSVALVVMPHSATSSVTGDDISTMVDSNAGV